MKRHLATIAPEELERISGGDAFLEAPPADFNQRVGRVYGDFQARRQGVPPTPEPGARRGQIRPGRRVPVEQGNGCGCVDLGGGNFTGR